MNRTDRENLTARVYAIWKTAAERNSRRLDPDDLDQAVAGTYKAGIVRRGPEAVKEYAQAFFDEARDRLHDWSTCTRKDSGSVADGLAHGADSLDSASFDAGFEDPRRVNAIENLRAVVTDRSYGRGELNFSAPVQAAQPAVGNLQFAAGSELLDMAKPGNLDLLLVPADPAATFAKARRVLEVLDSPWPADMAPPATRPAKMVGPLK